MNGAECWTPTCGRPLNKGDKIIVDDSDIEWTVLRVVESMGKTYVTLATNNAAWPIECDYEQLLQVYRRGVLVRLKGAFEVIRKLNNYDDMCGFAKDIDKICDTAIKLAGEELNDENQTTQKERA